jgi:RNA polymerase sigma-70 factor (ECF subfamily)
VARTPVVDDQLIRELYDQHGRELLAYTTRLMGGDRQRAEDIVQETILRAWRHPEVLDSAPDRSPRGWLFTVARNLTVDAYRARAARPAEAFEEVPDAADVRDGGFDVVLTRFEMLEALDSLSEQHRDVIVALFYLDHSTTDAAQLLGIPEGTVKSRCHYALKALRLHCDERGLLR